MSLVIHDKRALKWTVGALFFLALLAVGSRFWGQILWLNITASEPFGLYKLESFTRLERGDLVVFDVPAEFRPYVYGRHWLPENWALFKQVGAVPGDSYCVSDSGFSVNGIHLGPVYTADRQGFPLPQWRGCRKIPAGHFLPVATRIRRSFDGRYMGPVPVTQIKGRLRPLMAF